MAGTQGQLREDTVRATHEERLRRDRERNSDEIRRDIDQTRCEMDVTIDELGERLHPRHLLDDVLDLFRSSGGSSSSRVMGRRMIRKVKNNPIPAALAAAGLVWLMSEDDRPRRRREPRMYSGSYVDARTGEPYDEHYGEEWVEFEDDEPRMHSGSYVDARTGEPYDDSYGEEFRRSEGRSHGRSWTGKAKDAMHKAGETISETAESIGETVSGAASKAGEWAGKAGETAGEWSGKARHGAGRMGRGVRSRTGRMSRGMSRRMSHGYGYSRDRFEEAVEDYPLAVGVGFLALGALVGLALPRTRCEDEMMGEQSDHLKHQAREQGEELVERGREAVQTTVKDVTRTVKDDLREQELTPGSLSQKVQNVAVRTLEAAQEAAHDEGIAPSDIAEKAKVVAQDAKETAKHDLKNQTQTVEQTSAAEPRS